MEGVSVMAKGNKKWAPTNTREALNQFKQEIADEIGIPLDEGQTGGPNSKNKNSIDNEMIRRMVKQAKQSMLR